MLGKTVPVANCAERPLERGRTGDVAVGESDRQPVEKQVGGTRLAS
jgi:hypothetical protein